VTESSNDKENWARLVAEIQQAKAACEASSVETTVLDQSVQVAQSQSVPAVQVPQVAPQAIAAHAVAPQAERVASAQPAALPSAVAAPHATADFDRDELANALDEFLGPDDTGSQIVSQPARSGIRRHLGWGIAGFILGAVCWHLVGFWGFVGDVVFSKPQNTTVVERTTEQTAKPRVLSYVKKRASNTGAQSSRNCSAFYRDTETGMARPVKCQNIVRSPGSIGATAKN